MRKLTLQGFLFLLLCLSVQGLSAQELKVGPFVEGKGGAYVQSALSNSATGITVLKWGSLDKDVYSIQKFDKQLNPGSEVLLPTLYAGERMAIEAIQVKGDSAFFFLSHEDKKLDKKLLFVQRFNLKTMRVVGSAEKMAELSFVRKKNAGSFTFNISPDESKLLIYCNTESQKKMPDKYDLVVLNFPALTPLWKKSVEMPYAEDRFMIESVEVDNFGDAYMLGVWFNENPDDYKLGVVIEGAPARHQYKILTYRAGDAAPTEYAVNYGEMVIKDLLIHCPPDQKSIICAGFYSKKYNGSVDGTYYIEIDRASKAIVKEKGKEFDLDFLTMEMNKREEKRTERKEANGKDVEMKNLRLYSLVHGDNGKTFLIGEQVLIESKTMTAGSGTKTYIDYEYEMIIVVSIAPDGSIEWATKIPKKQHTIDDGALYSSFEHFYTNDKLYFVYNDEHLNLELKPGEKMMAMNAYYASVFLASVDLEGKVERKVLLSRKDMEGYFIPSRGGVLDEHTFMVYFDDKKGFRIGTIKY